MKSSTKKEIISWIKSIAIAFIIVFICREFIFTPITVFGESMSPTFHDADRVVVSKTSKIQRFDVIVFDAPDIEGKQYIKRVIGLPGDSIKMEDDVLYINGEVFSEEYLIKNKEKTLLHNLTGNFSLEDSTGETEVPNDMLFVMGDNRLDSKDSRMFGFVPYDSVIGEVKLRFYPFQKIGLPE